MFAELLNWPSQETVALSGNTWAMAEVTSHDVESVENGGERPRPPAVVTQHMEGDRRFVLLNPNVSPQPPSQYCCQWVCLHYYWRQHVCVWV